MKLLILFCLILCSCANPLYKPSARLAQTVLPEYKIYVNKDKKLTKEQKNRRLKGVLHYEKLLRDYREIEGN